MNPWHLVWLLPLVAVISAKATIDVYRWHRLRQAQRLLEDMRRQQIETGMQALRTARGVTRHPVIAHHFHQWEQELNSDRT